MGKYMKKNKMGGTVVDISLGVRTRARTLALEQLKKQEQQKSMNVLNFCYLELRSRKLEKVFFKATTAAPRPPSSSQLKKQQQPRQVSAVVRSEASIGAFVSISRSSSYLASSARPDSTQPATIDLPEARTAELEASCGDNVFDQDANSSRDSFGTEHFRRVREGTPVHSSSMNSYQPVEAPGSSSRPQVHPLVQSSSHHTRTGSGTVAAPLATLTSTTPSSPTQEEIEDFFGELEDAEAKGQCDRYNYDFLNDVPLPGRFEWVVEPAAATVDQHQQCI